MGENNDHPRFLGFLWKHHKFERRKDKPCTEQCIHCEEERHNPCDADTEYLGKIVDGDRSWFCSMVEIHKRKCKICGMEECRIVAYGAEGGFSRTKWEEIQRK